MSATVSEFHYGAVTPITAYLMACLGSALGLRCITRSMHRRPGQRRWGWLLLGSVSLGCGIWTMHFIAMIGFSVEGALVSHDPVRTVLSLLVAIVVVALGVFLVGYRGAGAVSLGTAGLLTGVGVAAMHYLGMTAMHTGGTVHDDIPIVAASVVTAVLAATAALWAAVTVSAVWATVGASLVMGAAVSVMHYTGMAAVSVQLTGSAAGQQSSTSLLAFLLVMLAGPLAVLIVSAVVVLFDPEVMLGSGDWENGAGGPAPLAASGAREPDAMPRPQGRR